MNEKRILSGKYLENPNLCPENKKLDDLLKNLEEKNILP